jgi:hypothetical protein
MLAIIGDDSVFVATPQIGEALNRAVAAAHAWMAGAAPNPSGAAT